MVDGNENREISNMEEALQHMDEQQPLVVDLKKGAPVSVVVLEKHTNELVVEIGAKSEGTIPREQLVRPWEEYQANDKIEGVITYINEDDGQIVISERKYAFRSALEKVRKAFEEHTPVEGVIEGFNRGGFTVTLFNVLRAFLPSGQSMLKKSDSLIGQSYTLEVIDFKSRRRGAPNIVVSRRKLFEAEIKEFFEKLQEGSILEGRVESIENFGIFVDLGKVTGLIPRSELSYDRSADPNDFASVGQKIKSMVLKASMEREKVTLSLKALQSDPWDNAEENYPAGKLVKGTVLRILPFGFVVKFDDGIEGLVHSSEIFWTRRRMDIHSVVQEGEQVEVEVLNLNLEKRKLSLSLKRVKGNPWEEIEKKFPVGKVVDAKVVKILPNGLIAELEEGVSGFVHVTELSWNFLDSIEEAFNVGDTVSVMVLEVSAEQQRMRLSIRKVDQDPWQKAVDSLRKGDSVTGQIMRLTNTGAVVLLDEYKIEAFLPVSQISQDRVEKPADVLNVGDTVKAQVVRTVYEPEKDRRNMVISIKQRLQDSDVEDYSQYMNADSSRVTMAEIVKQKEQE
ncbi:MAG TPA: S1 RNA-binding domain-containing protein [Thermotogota bacterium]|nr:S1 RNA-binding domain-containing protein [Thermotogota bacterium]HRW91722.1 S1 RNA-binding domain-containing protein [Thermotogota bacterium]